MPAKLPEKRLAELTAEVDRWSRLEIEKVGRFSPTGAAAHLGRFTGNPKGKMNGRLLQSLLDRLGDVIRYPGNLKGLTRTTCTVEQMTLGRILDVAAQHLNAVEQLRRGGRTGRDVETLTPSQVDDARGAARFAATVLAGGGDRLADVSGDALGWDVSAGKAGGGDWTLCAVVAAASDKTAREKYEAKHPGKWAAEMNGARRMKQVSSIRLLLDFAATRGLLTRGPQQATAMASAPDWSPVGAKWEAEMAAGRAAAMAHKAGRGIRLLALYATRRGWMTPAATDWARLREAILADLETTSLKHSAMDAARFAFNLLHAFGHLPERWPCQGDTRESLVPNAAAMAAARTGDFTGWVLPDGRAVHALTEGALGLRDWWRWATTPTSLLKASGLPARAYPNPSERQRLRAARQGDKAFRLGETSCKSRLALFNLMAGAYASAGGLDWTQQGADELCNPAHLQSFAIARDRAAGRKAGSSVESTVSMVAFALATLASPYLEARAGMEADRAAAAGDQALAEALRQRAQQLRAWSTDLKEIGIKHSSSDRDADRSTKAQETWLAWSADGVSGWHKLRTMRDLIVQDAEREFARCLHQQLPNGRWRRQTDIKTVPLEEQIAIIERERNLAVAERTFRPRQRWVTRVRDAVVVTVLHRVPLRERNVVGMTVTNWKSALTGRGTAQPWEGRISLAYSAEEMKGDRPFSPLFLAAEERETQDGIASARPALLQLYLMPGGAREESLRLPASANDVVLSGKQYGPGDVIPSPYIFPSLARKSGRGNPELRLAAGCRWDEDAFAANWTSVIRRYAVALNVDMERLKAVFGAAGPHAVRHLFGTHHCNPTDHPDAIGLQNASKMLHHRDTAITQSKYIGTSETTISVTPVARQQGGTDGRTATAQPARPADGSMRALAMQKLDGKLDALLARSLAGEIDDATLDAEMVGLERLKARLASSAAA